MYKYSIPLLIFFLLEMSVFLFGSISPDIQRIAAAYENGDLNKCSDYLLKAAPGNDEEEALVLYFRAILNSDTKTTEALLKEINTKYSRTYYAQKALSQLGHLSLLDRDYTEAIGYFNKITEPRMNEKHYWIATAYFQKGDYSNAIDSANQYIRASDTGSKLEDSYYLLADSYIFLGQYNNAVSTLKKLLSKPEIIHNEQYLRYRYGYAAEMLDWRAEAVSQYKQGYLIDRFSQLAYQIEDRLFDLRYRFGSSIDLSFLYPYCESPLPDIVTATNNPNGICNPNVSDSSSVTLPDVPTEITYDEIHGIFLQGGRFSNLSNAIRLCEKILGLKLNARYYKSTQFKDISWVIVVGPFLTQLEAENAKNLLRDNEIDSFIVQR